MRVAITGTTGRVGGVLARVLAERHDVISLPRAAMDLADAGSIRRVLGRYAFDWLLNPAGLTGLEACEDDPGLAWRLNAEVPGELAAICAERGAGVLHFSTDYVFAGREPGLRHEAETPEPQGVYGTSKLAGELAALAACPTACVMRVSWVFGAEKTSFVDQIIATATAGRPLEAICDKFSLPTRATDLAGWVKCLLESRTTGVIHACQSGDPVSWHGMADEIVRLLVSVGALATPAVVNARFLDEFKEFRAPRPRHSAMATGRLAGILGHPPRDWRAALADEIRGGFESR